MTFTSNTANLKHNAGMDKSDIEQGYEVLLMDPVKDSVANKRLGLTNPWVKVEGGEDDLTEWSD